MRFFVDRLVYAAAFAAIVGVGTALWASAGFAEGALAIGLPGGDPRNGFAAGYASNMKTTEEAQSYALDSCRKATNPRTRDACKVVGTFHDECANVAVNGDRNTPSTAVGWAFGPDSRSADSRALAICEAMRSGKGRVCQDDGAADCDGSAK
jgi:hypothetical protein